MSDIEIKKEIYKYFKLHKNMKLFLDNKKMEFQMWIGTCESIWVGYPLKVKRDLIIEEILK